MNIKYNILDNFLKKLSQAVGYKAENQILFWASIIYSASILSC